MQKFMHINRTCMTSKQRFSCVGINEYSVRLKRFAFMWSISLKRFASTKRFASAFRFSDPFCINRVFPLAGPRHKTAPWRRYMVAFRASGAHSTSLDTLRQRLYCPSGVLRVLQLRWEPHWRTGYISYIGLGELIPPLLVEAFRFHGSKIWKSFASTKDFASAFRLKRAKCFSPNLSFSVITPK